MTNFGLELDWGPSAANDHAKFRELTDKLELERMKKNELLAWLRVMEAVDKGALDNVQEELKLERDKRE